jgi:4-hydroxyphenylpyruvate dioxygenase
MKTKGVEFLSAPPHAYYEAISSRLGKYVNMMQEDYKQSKRWQLWSMPMLMAICYRFLQNQLRTEPHFFEIIQRMGAKGFGFGNFKALF